MLPFILAVSRISLLLFPTPSPSPLWPCCPISPQRPGNSMGQNLAQEVSVQVSGIANTCSRLGKKLRPPFSGSSGGRSRGPGFSRETAAASGHFPVNLLPQFAEHSSAQSFARYQHHLGAWNSADSQNYCRPTCPEALAAAAAKSLQSCPTLCDPIDGSSPGSPRPWDSPGKNTGVGCHFLLQRMKVKSESEVAQSCPTLRDPMDCSLPGSSVHGIFQARVLEWGAIAFSETLWR